MKSRRGNIFERQVRVFVNGAPAGPVAMETTLIQGPWLRLDGLAGYPFFNGALGEMYISNVVRYTGTFMPAASSAVDANTLRLWRFNEGNEQGQFGCCVRRSSDPRGNHRHRLQ
ncbi:MAG: hypothetical protein RMK99_09115 [Anaerolineales bacterium]|nr:hypothetical protein [Anaerolineales bacterium]